MIKSQVMRRTGHVMHMGEKTNAYRGMVKKPEGKRSLRRPMSRMKDNIEINPTETGWDRIHLAQDTHKWCTCEHRNAHSSSRKCGEFLD